MKSLLELQRTVANKCKTYTCKNNHLNQHKPEIRREFKALEILNAQTSLRSQILFFFQNSSLKRL